MKKCSEKLSNCHKLTQLFSGRDRTPNHGLRTPQTVVLTTTQCHLVIFLLVAVLEFLFASNKSTVAEGSREVTY